MTLLSTAYRYSKMSLHAEETVLKARRELLRLGCHHDDIQVSQSGSNLRLTYDGSMMTINAFEALSILKGIRRPAQAKDVWAILSMANRNKVVQKNGYSRHVFISAVFLVTAFSIVVLLK